MLRSEDGERLADCLAGSRRIVTIVYCQSCVGLDEFDFNVHKNSVSDASLATHWSKRVHLSKPWYTTISSLQTRIRLTDCQPQTMECMDAYVYMFYIARIEPRSDWTIRKAMSCDGANWVHRSNPLQRSNSSNCSMTDIPELRIVHGTTNLHALLHCRSSWSEYQTQRTFIQGA